MAEWNAEWSVFTDKICEDNKHEEFGLVVWTCFKNDFYLFLISRCTEWNSGWDERVNDDGDGGDDDDEDVDVDVDVIYPISMKED